MRALIIATIFLLPTASAFSVLVDPQPDGLHVHAEEENHDEPRSFDANTSPDRTCVIVSRQKASC